MATATSGPQGDICESFSDFESDYEKLKQLGQAGQYGVTYLCKKRDRDPSEPHTLENPAVLAVKVINKERFKKHGPRLYNKWVRFQKTEISALLIANHPNIVKLYRVLEDPENVYMVMEYLEGGELLDFIVSSGHVSEYKVAHIIAQVLKALDYMHQRNILHLDLKPENIMLADKADYPQVKIIDFGFAAILPRLEKMEERRGTPYYMAPEMLDGKYDRSVDIWAAGVIAYCMLFGYLPFYDDHGGDIKVVYQQIREGFRPEVHRGCGPWFPRNIPVSQQARDFIAAMLRSDVSARVSVEEALAKEWVRGHASKDPLPEIVVRGLVQFCSAFQKNSRMALLVSDPALISLDTTHRESADSIIQEFADDDGRLPKSKFVEKFSQMTSMRRLELEDIFHTLDTNQDGFITAATVRRIEAFHQLVTVDDRLISLFNRLDEDKDGVLNEKELEAAIQKVSPQVQQLVRIRSLLEISDLNNDGVIDKEEFLTALHPSYVDPMMEPTLSLRQAKSLRHRSELYYDLLRQLEEEQGQPEIMAQKTLTVRIMKRPTMLDSVLEEDELTFDEEKMIHIGVNINVTVEEDADDIVRADAPAISNENSNSQTALVSSERKSSAGKSKVSKQKSQDDVVTASEKESARRATASACCTIL